MTISLKSVLLLFLTFNIYPAFAGGGDDHSHGEEKVKENTQSQAYFSSEAISDKYELFIKYEYLKPGKTSSFRLYLSDYLSNKAIAGASMKIKIPGVESNFNVSPVDTGIYEVSGIFPESKTYSLQVSINGPLGADLLLLQNIEVGKALLQADEETNNWYSSSWVMFLAGLLSALLLVFVLKIVNRRIAIFLLTILSILPAATGQYANAHEGHDEGADKKGGSFSNNFVVPKETQFLFGVLTQRLESGEYNESTRLYGTVLPASNGQSIIQAPQTGRIINLKVNVGQRVSKGQILAVIEQTIDAGTQVGLLSEKNNLKAEYDVAKKEYDRMKSIQDIAAKKDFDEAEARFQKASENLKLYNSGSGRTLTLKAPIDGVIGTFTVSVGSSINTGDILFTIVNLKKVYIEAQVFDKDVEKVKTGQKFTVTCSNDNHKSQQVKLLAKAQTINPTNQSQRVLFEMDNIGEEFKIGEFVDVRVFTAAISGSLALPNSAFTEINGRPAVFVKKSSENYSLVYVSTGNNNGTFTTIEKGLAEGSRVVTEGTYQLKMIYSNQ